MQLGKRAASAVSTLVKRGLLPCDAPLLSSRATSFIDLEYNPNGSRGPLRTRLLLSEHPQVLSQDPHFIFKGCMRIVSLVPYHRDPTALASVCISQLSPLKPGLESAEGGREFIPELTAFRVSYIL